MARQNAESLQRSLNLEEYTNDNNSYKGTNMNIHIKQIMDHSVHLFREKIESSSGNQNKVVIVALIALGCLAAYLYYSMVVNPPSSKSDKKITPQAKADKAVPKKAAPKEAKAHPLKKETKQAELAADDILAEDDEEILESKDLESRAAVPDAKKASAPKKDLPRGRTQRAQPPASGQKKGDLNPLLQEEEDVKKALLLSMQDLPPENDADDAEAAIVEAALKESAEEAAKQGYLPVTADDDEDDLEEIMRQIDEAEEREVLEASKKEAVKKPPVKAAQKTVAAPKKPPAPAPKKAETPKTLKKAETPQTPKKAETPKTPKKAETPVDKALLETAKANSDKSEDTLDIAVKNAQEKLPKIGITGHEIKRNDVGGAFLVLKFSSELKRNLAVEELRNPPYSMFQTKQPSRDVGTTELELDVDQTIDFQNKF